MAETVTKAGKKPGLLKRFVSYYKPHTKLFCMDMEKLGREYAGKITFRGEIDRQYLLPFGTEEEVRAGVRRAYKALCPDGKLTGCFAQCEWGVKDPAVNFRAVYDEWDKIAQEQ